AAMLWLYGVAWHQPMAESIDWMRSTVSNAIRWPGSLPSARAGEGVKIAAPAPRNPAGATVVASSGDSGSKVDAKPDAASVDPDVTALIAERKARAAALKSEGLRMLAAGNWRRAAELCGEWTDLDLSNPEAWR